jgi:predicted ATPase/DNA-binding SARP family transcriptional activator
MMETATPHIFPLEFRLFGTFEARVQDNPLPLLRYRKAQWLLALLVLRHDREVSRDWLAATFWPDNDESQALFYLRKNLSNLRHVLGSEAHRLLSPTPRTLRFDLSGAYADVLCFDAATCAPATASAEALEQAVALYRGPLLVDCPDEWVTTEREARAQVYLAALETLAQQSLANASPTAAARWLRLILANDPYRESAYAALMQALADCGDRAAVIQVYRDLRVLLRNELNTTPGPEIETLYHRLIQQEAPLPKSPYPTTSTGTLRHLPVPLNDLIGRQEEKEAILGYLSKRRLVTLVGSGGVGKTRLAIASAEALLPDFAHGVWFVDLAAVSDPAQVAHAAARTLGVLEEKERPLAETLVDFLSRRALLLVLDNCEHLIDACASLAFTLLSACPELRVLATSRQALGVTGEQMYRVPSLTFPTISPNSTQANSDSFEKDLQVLLEYDAVRLFVERARQVHPAFQLNRRSAEAITDICQQLDGIPLAIEMAAARMRALSATEIQERLADRFRLLTSGNRATLPRQQTLHAAIEWSYDLLTPPERDLLRYLSVFTGGWSREGVEAICKEEGGRRKDESMTGLEAHPSSFILHPSDTVDLLMALVDKSLVTMEERGETPRYAMLESVRQYGRELLTKSGELGEAQQRHRDYYLRMAERSYKEDDVIWMDRLEQEHDNLRAAQDFCLAEADSITMGLRFVVALHGFWAARGYLREGIRRGTALLAHPNAQSPDQLRAGALYSVGRMTWQYSDYTGLSTLFAESLAIYQMLGDKNGTARAMEALGGVLEDEQGDAYLAESLALYQETGNQSGVAQIHRRRGINARMAGDLVRARQWLTEGLELSRRIENRLLIAHILHDLSYLNFVEGDLVSAQTLEEEALQQYREIGNRMGELIGLQHLGWVNLWLDNWEKTRTCTEASLHMQKAAWRRQEFSTALECLAEVACREEKWARAACLWGAVDTFQKTYNLVAAEGRKEPLEKSVAVARARLGEEAFAHAWKEGKAMTLETALHYALNE